MPVKKLQTLDDRLSVYTEVLSFLESNTVTHSIWCTPKNVGLCILLPCAWGNISWEEDFIDSDGEEYIFTDTFKYFPEIIDYYYRGCSKYYEIYLKDPVAWRILILKEIISKK